jgi:threonine dehydrogenase-like Zn-dependent dehydrogenase
MVGREGVQKKGVVGAGTVGIGAYPLAHIQSMNHIFFMLTQRQQGRSVAQSAIGAKKVLKS